MKSDPISKKYYAPIECVEGWAFVFFLLGGALSFVPLFEAQIQSYKLYEEVQIFFLIVVLILFALNHILRLYLFPRAEESRVQDFLSSAYNVKLIQDTTEKYYNNDENNGYRRLALQLLEDLLCTKDIASKMLQKMRIFCGLYLIGWLILILSHEVNLGEVFVVSQVLFSEEVFSKFLRLECLRHRANRLYGEVYRLLTTKMDGKHFRVQSLEKFIIYERAKASLAVTLSSKIFHNRSAKLTADWDIICKSLESNGV